MKGYKYVKVQDVFDWFKEGGLELLKVKINDPSVYVSEASWQNNIKLSLNKNLYKSVKAELDWLLSKQKFYNERK